MDPAKEASAPAAGVERNEPSPAEPRAAARVDAPASGGEGLAARALDTLRALVSGPAVAPSDDTAFDEGERLEAAALKPPHETLEGVSMGDLLRCKIMYLSAQNRALAQQSQVADAKGATLMTVIGLLIVNGPFANDYRTTGDLVSLAVLILAALGFTASLYAIIPRFPNAGQRDLIALRDRYSWPGLASDLMDREAYAQFVRDSQATHLILSMSRSNGALAKILLNKYTSLRLGFAFGLTAFATFGLDFLFLDSPT